VLLQDGQRSAYTVVSVMLERHKLTNLIEPSDGELSLCEEFKRGASSAGGHTRYRADEMHLELAQYYITSQNELSEVTSFAATRCYDVWHKFDHVVTALLLLG
jgi:hypothetical protein